MGKLECDSLYSITLDIPLRIRAKVASNTRIMVNSITCLYFEAISIHYSTKDGSPSNIFFIHSRHCFRVKSSAVSCLAYY